MIYGSLYGHLFVKDGKICNQDGANVLLRGVSLFWSHWGGHFYNKATIDRLVDDWKIDVVRTPISLKIQDSLSDLRRQIELASIVIDAAISRGIYVIIDWHSHDLCTDMATKAFTMLAKKYRGIPNLIWETFNEPNTNLDWNQDIVPHHIKLIDCLRSLHANGLVICGTPNFCSNLEPVIQFPIDRQNVAYAVHFYAASHGFELRHSMQKAIDQQTCIFVSEYGLGSSDGDGALDIDEIGRWWRFLEKNKVSHVNWSIIDKNEACAAVDRVGIFGRWILSKSGNFVRSMLRSH